MVLLEKFQKKLNDKQRNNVNGEWAKGKWCKKEKVLVKKKEILEKIQKNKRKVLLMVTHYYVRLSGTNFWPKLLRTIIRLCKYLTQ